MSKFQKNCLKKLLTTEVTTEAPSYKVNKKSFTVAVHSSKCSHT